MTTAPATMIALAVLASAGVLPVVALVGLRWITIPLVPLGGAVIAALAATGFLAGGATFMDWFVGLAALAAASVLVDWGMRPHHRPWTAPVLESPARIMTGRRIGAVGAIAIGVACGWCLRGLSTPTIGFDARTFWLMRPGWFLQSHHQLLVNMRIPGLLLTQTAYPPLVSASTAVGWSVTGNQSMRLGVVIVALLNTCALATAAFAVIEAGRQFSLRLASGPGDSAIVPGRWRDAGSAQPLVFAPMVVGVVSAVLLIFIAFGITEPFMTNGYADPIWSLAAVGAVAYGLQLSDGRSNQAVALVLLLVSGMSKDEGFVTSVAIIALIAIRRVATMSTGSRRRWCRPVGVAVAELAAVAAWPIAVRAVHARAVSASFSPVGDWASRAHAAYSGMEPYLHVILLAAPVAVVGGLALSHVRRASGLANDWWGWAALTSGLVAVGGTLITGTAAISSWLVSTVHRVTAFPALTAWWIVAMWAVAASGAPALDRVRTAPGHSSEADRQPGERSVPSDATVMAT